MQGLGWGLAGGGDFGLTGRAIDGGLGLTGLGIEECWRGSDKRNSHAG